MKQRLTKAEQRREVRNANIVKDYLKIKTPEIKMSIVLDELAEKYQVSYSSAYNAIRKSIHL